jgi:hypothetical protein
MREPFDVEPWVRVDSAVWHDDDCFTPALPDWHSRIASRDYKDGSSGTQS